MVTIGSWLNWQIDYLLILQNFRDFSGHVFDNFFLKITMFGEILIPTLFICLILWCVNKKKGFYLVWCFILNFITITFFKFTACVYRPWILSSDIHPVPQAIKMANGYSFPSGHTANAMSVWGGTVVSFWKNLYVRYLGIALILLVIFSRNYLGVHTPQDVIISFLIGLFILYFTNKVLSRTDNKKNGDLILVSVISGSCILLFYYVLTKSYPIDILNGKLLYDATNEKMHIVIKSCSLFGLMTGWVLERRFINFDIENTKIIKRIFRYLLGVLLFMLLITYGENLSIYALGELTGKIIYNFILGLFITSIYPLIFKLIRL